MILLNEKGAHGVSSRCEKAGMLLPQRSYGSTLKNHMLLITNSTTVASQTNPVKQIGDSWLLMMSHAIAIRSHLHQLILTIQ